jgi:hypothetical protein
MTHVLAAISLLLLVRDPLGSVVVGGAAGLTAAFFAAALLGCALNALRRGVGTVLGSSPARRSRATDARPQKALRQPAGHRDDDARDHRELGHTGLTAHGTA